MTTFITGKDATLEETIERFQTQLQALGFNIDSIESASWHNPLPNIWSVQIRDIDAPMNVSHGKGTSQKSALASALGDYLTRLATNDFYNDYYLGEAIANNEFVHYPNEKWFPIDLEENLPPEAILDERLTQFYDPTLELLGTDLIDLQSSNMERGICTLPLERQSDKQTIYMPVNIIGNLYASSGISAGNTQFEARTQALSEIIERKIKSRVIDKQISLPEIPEPVISRFAKIQQSIDALKAKGFRVNSYDASLGGKYPVVCVVLSNPDNSASFASFGAHPCFEVAVERAMTELLQGRSLDELHALLAPCAEASATNTDYSPENPLAESANLVSPLLFQPEPDFDFADWNIKGTSEEHFTHLVGLLHAEGADIYIADYDHLGVDCCRIIVPGWSEVSPVEDLIEANNNVALELREVLLALPSIEWDAEQYAEMFHIAEEEFDDNTLLPTMLGMATDTGSAWQTLRVGELKCLIALAGGDLELALEYAEWSIGFNASTYSADRTNFFRCLVDSLKLALDEEHDPATLKADFERTFGAEVVAAAWGSIEGSVRFHGLTAGDLTMRQFPTHQQLLQSYHKLQAAKKQN
ncbi:YcaO-like family protein [Photobacterium sp. ZSDE20]|uniref:30S ribosomal protein S12 methylthiotransferase accessory factor YcaO n=1 Tax=Photobacterium pectinilyticum TaxID=2906793 RepID=A0ABT1MY82_9GAMM|nr:30S ribosomal protein S12 methylthiotransferase accessory factor YcaO [Photobacterium sp. ZSDE20]MCQ1057453.1 30S ribosomal protein S12 methylthiotransferase accessory factor YcaO [Photobacterium sp. ZSDE20]MDD1821598.1 YcaO-like family protein [Photobacterium sp. ZSDE20]